MESSNTPGFGNSAEDGKEVKRDDGGSDRQEVSFVVWVQPQVCPSGPIGKLDKVCTRDT